MTERERSEHAHADAPREEAALPTRRTGASKALDDIAVDDRRAARGLLAFSLLFALLWSAGLEFAGWRIVADAASPTPTPIDWLGFLRGVGDNVSGAVGIGALGGLAPMLFPGSWKRPWRRMAAGFFAGACGFLGFLSVLTLTYFL